MTTTCQKHNCCILAVHYPSQNVSPCAVWRLQVVFKQLLSLKWAERDLGQAWQSMRATKRLSGCVRCPTVGNANH
jgi:hypothetical protein